ncbi:MAG: hypothetical protein JWO11_1451 [Nocardioides sp.]|nr:hypothetical protein [Nocardioides sp.]
MPTGPRGYRQPVRGEGSVLSDCSGTRTPVQASIRSALPAVGLAIALGMGAGCAPASPDHATWTDQAKQSLSDAVSDVSTVSLVLRLQQRGDLAQNYQQVVALDSEETLGLTAQKFGSMQPPVGDDAEYSKVTTALSDASDLLVDIRIAVVRENSAQYPDLLRKLTKTRSHLLSLQKRLR